MKINIQLDMRIPALPPPLLPYRWGMIAKCWEWENVPEYKTWKWFPQSQKLCAKGNNPSRGRNIPVTDSAWRIIRRNNDARGYDYARSVGMVWINRAYVGSGYYIGDPYGGAVGGIVTELDPVALAEPIVLPNNPIAIIGETTTHYQIATYHYTQNFDNLKDNWFTHPWLWPKCSAVNRAGDIANVTSGVDCVVPQMNNDGAWVEKGVVELAPTLPFTLNDGRVVIGYRLTGADWLGRLSDGTEIYLRRVTHNGWMDFGGWKMRTKPVIPIA